jgi:hypothetical protein
LICNINSQSVSRSEAGRPGDRLLVTHKDLGVGPRA